ncbi:MAG: S9 family peptidase [Phycisphaeraceae bacterium]|nr:S9 family peptidase [Phycisphaeraceae bacterium]
MLNRIASFVRQSARASRLPSLALLSAIVLSGAAAQTAAADEPIVGAGAAPAAQTEAAKQARPGESGMPDNTDVSLIPRSVLFGDPERARASISPDGKLLAFLAPHGGALNVHVCTPPDVEAARPLTSNTRRGVAGFSWAYDSEHILYVDDANGDENFRVYSVNVRTGEKKDLTPLDGVRAEIVMLSPKFPNEVVLGLNDREPALHDLHRVNIATGERTLLLQNAGWVDFTLDLDFRVRLAARVNPDGSIHIHRLSESGDVEPSAEPFMVISMEDTANTSIAGFDATGDILTITSSQGRDTSAVYEVDMKTGARRMLLGVDNADAGALLIDPRTRRVQAVEIEHERSRWNLLSMDLVEDLQFLRKTNVGGDMLITSRSQDDRLWTVAFVEDEGPVKTYLYDRGKRAGGDATGPQRMAFLFANRPELERAPLAPMHHAVIKTRDGLDMVVYYTLPRARDTDGNGVPDRALPMVLNVHGGPWARDSWGLDPEHQWLANRGYAVMSVNFRGSTGFGKNFLNAANGEWGGKMHDDLLDAVMWAVERGIADPAKVAIYGGSYGGYATLVGMTFTPEVFACGVSVVGPSSLVTLLESVPEYWKPVMDLMVNRIGGDHRTPDGRAFLESRSPLSFVDRIARPLLIGQGANDPRVKQAESDQIVAAMGKKDLPVTYVLFPDEGHGFARPENRMSFYAVTEAFLAQHLGGRVEPIGDAFEGSSITVPHGHQFVPGLSEAIGK